MTYEQMTDLLRQRRSIRYFSEKDVSDDVLRKLMEVVRFAPSVENTKPWRFHVIKNTVLKKRLMEHTCYGNFTEGASVFIVVTCDRSAKGVSNAPIWNPKEMEFSCVAAMDYIMLAATSLGLGTCWTSLHHGAVHNLLALKDREVVVGGLMIGWLKDSERSASGDRERKPVETVIIYHDHDERRE